MRGIICLAVLLAAISLGLSTAAVEAGQPVPTPTPTPESGGNGDCPAAGTDNVDLQVNVADIIVDTDEPLDGVPDTSVGGTILSGPATIVRGDCEVLPEGTLNLVPEAFELIHTEIVSMNLCGTVQGFQVCMRAGTGQGLQTPSLGEIVDTDPFDGSFFPALSFFDVVAEVDTQNFGTVADCNGSTQFEATITAVPPIGATYTIPGGGDLELCTQNPGQVITVMGIGALTVGPIGGIVDTPVTGDSPGSPVDSSSGSGFNYAALAGGLAAAAIAIGVGGWYARKRWLW